MRSYGGHHTSLTGSLRAAQPPQPLQPQQSHQLPQPHQLLNRQTGWPPSGWPSGLRPTLMEAVAKEIQDPDETTLWGYAK